MKKTFAIFSLLALTTVAAPTLASEPVQAVKVHTSFGFALFDTVTPGESIQYSCSSVEYSTRSMLEKMGATNIDVHCTGGLDDSSVYMAPSATVSFDAVRLASHAPAGIPVRAAWAPVSIRDHDGCALAQQVLANLREHLEVQGLDGTLECMDPDMGYDFELSVLKEL